jgi:hypothetical protein
MLWDDRADVRRLGVALTRAEFRRWGQLQRIYELAESPHKEVRNVAYAALGRLPVGTDEASDRAAELRIGASSISDLRLTPEELDPPGVFAMTESRIATTRDAAMSLIQEHYPRLGGPERLGWLMQSADRDVRLFAVRLLWDRHRSDLAGLRTGPALEELLRRTLFSIPPARGGQKAAFRKRLPANIAKRRLVEVLRDLALADRSFAERIAPILAEMTGSIARGEWQICVSALLALRAAHGLTVPEIAPAEPSG